MKKCVLHWGGNSNDIIQSWSPATVPEYDSSTTRQPGAKLAKLSWQKIMVSRDYSMCTDILKGFLPYS